MRQLTEENERLKMGGGAANVLDLLAEAPKDVGDRMESPPLSATSPLTLEDSATWAVTPTKSVGLVQPAAATITHDVSNTKSAQLAAASSNHDVTKDKAKAAHHHATYAPAAERSAARKENARHAGQAGQAGQASASGVTSGTKQGISAGGAASVGNLAGGGATKGKLLPVRATRGLAPAR
jgi:hypothetical protein